MNDVIETPKPSKFAIYSRRHYLKHRQRRLNEHKVWAEKNKAHLAEYARNRRSEKPELREHHREYCKRYYQANKEKLKAAATEYAAKHIEKRKLYNKAYRAAKKNDAAFKESHRRRSAANYRANKAKIRKRHAEWFKKNPGAYAALKARRRALEKYAAVNLHKIKEWMDSVKGKDTAVCYYCQRRVSTKGIHFDHIVALTKGGPHRVENLCVACETCNISKHNKPLRIWTRHSQQMLEL